MKDVWHRLNETTEIKVAPAVLKGTLRELEMDELGLVCGAQKATTIWITQSQSGGAGNDDSHDGGNSLD